MKGLETCITGSYFPSFTKIVRREYSINASDVTNHNVYFGPYLTFQIIPYDCLLTNLNCCLSYVSNEQYLMKIDLLITKMEIIELIIGFFH